MINGHLSSLVKSIPGRDSTLDRLEALEKAVKQLRTARSADYTTVGQGGTFQVDGNLNVSGSAAFTGDTTIGGTLDVGADVELGGNTTISGDLTVSGTADISADTTISGDLNVSGDTEFSGNLDVNGTTTLDGTLTLASGATLTASGDVESANYVAGSSGWKLSGTTGDLEINTVTIRGGIIGQDALAHALSPAYVNSGVVSGLTFTSSWVSYVSETVTVPAGFTQAMVIAHPNASMPAATAGGLVAVLVRALVDGNAGPEFEALGDDGAFATAPFGIGLTGLSGSFTIECQAKAVGGGSTGIAAITALVIFTR